MNRRHVLQAALTALPLAALSRPAAAQSFPTRPVRVVVPYAPGGGTDIVARIMAQAASDAAGQSFVVENRGGGASLPGTQAVVNAAPDGYTTGFVDSALVTNPGLFGDRMPFDTERDLAPVGLVAVAPLVLVAPREVPFATVREAVARARAQPGSLNIGHAGNGTAVHLAGAQLGLVTESDLVPVAYRGAGPMLTALLGGEIQLAFSAIPSAKPHIDGGRLRALAVTSPQRSSALPDVPTFTEAGFAAVDAVSLFGVVAPSATPTAVLDRLNALLVQPARSPAIAARLTQLGFDVQATTRDAFATLIRSETAKWRATIERAGIRAD
jgi:tripartite-type tricarboxylate transporter receptor subunit TctC